MLTPPVLPCYFLDVASACRVLPQSVLLQLLLPRCNGSLCCSAHVAVTPSVLQQLLLPSHSCSCSATAVSALLQLLLFNSSCFCSATFTSALLQPFCHDSARLQYAANHICHNCLSSPAALSAMFRPPSNTQPIEFPWSLHSCQSIHTATANPFCNSPFCFCCSDLCCLCSVQLLQQV